MKELKSSQEYVECSKKEKAVIEIYAPGCGPCQMLKEKVLSKIETDISVYVIDGTAYYEILDIIKNESGSPVSGVPVLMLYQNGKYLKRLNGYVEKNKILSFFD